MELNKLLDEINATEEEKQTKKLEEIQDTLGSNFEDIKSTINDINIPDHSETLSSIVEKLNEPLEVDVTLNII